MDSGEILQRIQECWGNKGSLSRIGIAILERQLELSRLIATEDMNFNSTFVQEREESYKGTDAMSKARAKMLVGNNKLMYEYEFEVLNNMLRLITLHISQPEELLLEGPELL